MSKPTKLLVHVDLTRAKLAALTFDLDDDWKVVGFGEALGAPRFERVVVMPGWTDTYSGAELDARKEYINRLKLTVREGVLIIL